MEMLHGVSVANVERLKQEGIDTKVIAKQGANIYINMIFRDRFFHADPHPGNIWVVKGGLVALSLLMLLMTGCGVLPRESLFMRKVDAVDLSSYQLRAILNDFVIRFGDEIEAAADHIIHETSDPDIRQQALLWKIHGIPAVHHAIFVSDRLIAMMDAWTLCIQMRLYFTEGAGTQVFGAWQPLAVEVSETLEREIIAVAQSTKDTAKIQRGEGLAYSWAQEHPLESLLFIRESIRGFLLTEVFEDSARDLSTTVGDVAASLQEIRSQVQVYSEHLPKQLRWETTYLLEQFSETDVVVTSLRNFRSITESAEHVARIFDHAPDLIDDTRIAVMQDIDRLRTALHRDVQDERALVLAGLQHERRALLDNVSHQRRETVQALQKELASMFTRLQHERTTVLDDVDRQRRDTLKAFEGGASTLLDDSSRQLKDVIDHLFWRILQLFAIAGLLGGFLIYMSRRKH